METNSKKILAALPSFEDYMALAEDVKKLSLRKMKLESDIRTAESFAFKEVMTDPEYMKQGKVVSVSFFENAYKHTGLHGEILPLRDEYAEIASQLDSRKTQFEIYKQMHDLYKALAYQEKGMA